MKQYIFAVVAVLVAASCVEGVVMDPNERGIVVNCILEEREWQTLTLTYSSGISESNYILVEDAKVYITEYDSLSGGTYAKAAEYMFYKAEEGLWKSDFRPKANRRYDLMIVVGEDTLTSSTRYIESRILSAMSNTTAKFESGSQQRITKIEDTIKSAFPTYSVMCQSNLEDGPFYFWVFGVDYDPLEDKYHHVDLITTPYQDSLHSLSLISDYYAFLDFFNVSDIKRTDIEEFRYPTDIEVKFPGVLEYGYPQYLHGIYRGAPNNMHYIALRIKYDQRNPKFTSRPGYDVTLFSEFCANLYIAASFKQYKYGVVHPKAYLAFIAVNDDYDKYLKSLISFEIQKRFKIVTSLTDIYKNENPVYSNINSNISNAMGIFGAMALTKVPYQDYAAITYNGVTYYKKYSLE